MLYAILFIVGLAVGSFLNVVIYRLHAGKSFLVGRSHCPKCKKVLAWYDLIPLVSFALNKGRCRRCGKKISWQYPLVELATGILFISVGWHLGGLTSQIVIWGVKPLVFNLLLYCFFISALIVIFVYDLKYFIIPDQVIYPVILIAFGYQAIRLSWFNYSITSLISILFAAGIAGGFFLVLVLASRGKWMGLGDVKLACFMGLLLGWPNILVALILSFVLGGIIGLGLILTKKKVFKSQIPFGPFLSAATLISIFWGNKLINWYLSFIGY